MYKFWLPLALGAGLLACGTPDTTTPKKPPTDAPPDDNDDDTDEDDQRGSSRPDAGRKPDAGKGPDGGKGTDGGRSDAGTVRGIDSSVPPDDDEPNSGASGGPDTEVTDVERDPAPDQPPQTGGGNPDAPPAVGGRDPVQTPPDAPTPPAGGGLGGGCGSDSDCGGGGLTCFNTVAPPAEILKAAPAFEGYQISFPGGYCTRSCTSDSNCGGDASCPFADIAAFVPSISQCAKKCTSDADCRDGYTCGTLPPYMGLTLGGAEKKCLPPIPPLPM